MVVNEYDGVSMSRTWQQYMPVIRQQSNCIRAANPDDIGVCVPTKNGLRFRRFTLSEMERMQTLPVGYTKTGGVSEIQSKATIGNGWTVDVIAHILSFINTYEDKRLLDEAVEEMQVDLMLSIVRSNNGEVKLGDTTERLCNKGYRKAADVVAEVEAFIMDTAWDYGTQCHLKRKFTELKKKYTEGGE